MTERQTTLGAYDRPDDSELPAAFDDLASSVRDDLQRIADELDEHLTPAERRIYLAVEIGGVGVREYQQRMGWSSPGTAANLIARAREKLPDDGVNSAHGGNP